jgi:hypothetical protein
MKEIIKTRVTDQNIVIPQLVIDKFHLSKGDVISWIIEDKSLKVEIVKEKRKLSSLIGAFDGLPSNSVEEHELIP